MAIFYKLNPKFSPNPRKVPTIIHQPHKSQNYVKIGFSGLKVNGISVSGPPFFGERPYPRQFHPVENDPLFAIFHPNRHLSAHNTHQITTQRSIIRPPHLPYNAIIPYIQATFNKYKYMSYVTIQPQPLQSKPQISYVNILSHNLHANI